MTPVKDQGAYPTCYGFAVNAILEALYYESFNYYDYKNVTPTTSLSVTYPIVSYLYSYNYYKNNEGMQKVYDGIRILQNRPLVEGRTLYIMCSYFNGMRWDKDFPLSFKDPDFI